MRLRHRPFDVFDLFQLLHQILRYQLEGLAIRLACLSVADSTNYLNEVLDACLTYPECVNELVERKAAVRRRLWHTHAADLR